MDQLEAPRLMLNEGHLQIGTPQRTAR
jgi:hypothetical protein